MAARIYAWYVAVEVMVQLLCRRVVRRRGVGGGWLGVRGGRLVMLCPGGRAGGRMDGWDHSAVALSKARRAIAAWMAWTVVVRRRVEEAGLRCLSSSQQVKRVGRRYPDVERVTACRARCRGLGPWVCCGEATEG